jgi:hypothetical protein
VDIHDLSIRYGSQQFQEWPISSYVIHHNNALVDRYKNIHLFYNDNQLIRDLFLFRLPTSLHSQFIMLNAFGALSSQSNYGERGKIEEFCRNYLSSFMIQYYTQDSFFYRIINRILRQQQLHVIYQYRHAIIDLIECIRRSVPSEGDSIPPVLWRGQQMTLFELGKMKNNVGELICTSSFLSSTMNRTIAEIFAGDGSDDNPCFVSVILKIYLDTSQPMRPYTLINNSAEEEVLFSPGTRFILLSCRKLHDNDRLWLIELKAIPEKQQEQLALTHGETFLLLSSASGWPTSVVVVRYIIT